MMMNLGRETYTWRPNPGSPALPMRQFGSFHPGQGLGGSAIHWSAQLWRYLETDFLYRSHTIERYGAGKLPAGSNVRDWGITYADLEPYYDRFEYDIGASGTTGNLRGQTLPGGNPFEAPRARPYPNPALEEIAFQRLFRETNENLGNHPFPQPSGILSRAWVDPWGHERSGCLYCGFCTRYGCEVDAKSSPVTTHLPVALDTGRYEVRTGCKVTQITCDNTGKATGVSYIDGNGQEHHQPASIVVSSAFTLANVRMLLISRNPAHPNGVGNDRGMVGKNYTYQLFLAPAKGVWPDRRFNFYMGNTSTMSFIYDYNADNFDPSQLDFVGGGAIYSQPGEREPVTSVDTIADDLGVASWGQSWKEFLHANWDSTGTINIQGESLPYHDQFLDLDPIYKDAFGQPLLRIAFDWHDNDRALYKFLAQKCDDICRAMGAAQVQVTQELEPYNIHKYQSTHPTGGAIMGTDPSQSVTNTYGQVWDTPNVFVTGGALFPQNPGANPTGTVGAVTYRAAEAIRDRYLKHPGELLE